MGREIRRVPKGWEHPRREDGYQPMHDQTYVQRVIGHFKSELWWYLWPLRHLRYVKEWVDGFPDKAYCRPRFGKNTAVCHQVYENVTEGTPTSPVFDTLDDLVEWLAEEGYSRKAAESFVKSGWVPSFVLTPGAGVVEGIECAALLYG